MQAKKKARKSNHGGARAGAGRKAASTCPMCAILAEQLKLAGDREKLLMKQIDRKDQQIGTVIESKFETVRVSNQPLPEPDRPAMPVEQLMDVEGVSDEDFLRMAPKVIQQ